jgi:hypothetical protein
MADIMEIFNAQQAAAAPAAPEAAPGPVTNTAPAGNISAVEANGVENPVDNGKTGAENEAAAKAEQAAAAPEAPKAEETPAPAPEAAPAAPEVTKPDSFAKRFAMAAQKEKELRLRELDLQKREAELKRAPVAPPPPAPVSKIDPKRQPLSFLHEHGLSVQDVQEALLRGEKAPEVDPLAERLAPLQQAAAELRALKDDLAKRDAEAAQKTFEAQVAGVKREVARMASADGYDMINAMGEFGVNTVFETMQQYYQTYEKVLTYKEACDIVEDDFETRYLPKLVESKKVKAKIVVPSTAPVASAQSAPAAPAKASPTLTNKQGAQPNANPDPKTMSRDEYIDWLARNMTKSQ